MQKLNIGDTFASNSGEIVIVQIFSDKCVNVKFVNTGYELVAVRGYHIRNGSLIDPSTKSNFPKSKFTVTHKKHGTHTGNNHDAFIRKYDLWSSNFNAMLRGEVIHHKGWTLVKLGE